MEFLAVALREAQRVVAEQKDELAACRRQRQQVTPDQQQKPLATHNLLQLT